MTARSRFPVRGARRKTTWVGPADQGYLAVAAGAKIIVASFDAASNGLASPTIVRSRGQVSIFPGAGVTGDVEIVGAYGLAIVSDRAFAAGVASIPGPWTDAGWDGWFVWRSFHYTQEFLDATSMLRNFENQEVDSRAMRKITDDETIVLIAESQAIGFEISMPLRILMKLS